MQDVTQYTIPGAVDTTFRIRYGVVMNTSEVIAAVRACTESQLREITAATGVPMPTLAKIKYGVTGDPRGSTVDKLREYFAVNRAAA